MIRTICISICLLTATGFTTPSASATELAVTLEMGGRGPRPYVVVWVENAEGKPVTTLKVWGAKNKYQRDLKTWYRSEGRVDGISGATRPNGTYRVSWDLTDANGQPVPKGVYRIRAESVREEGRRCLSSCTLTVNGTPTRAEGKADGDIRSLSVRLSPEGADED